MYIYIYTLYINSTGLFFSKTPSAHGPGPSRLAALRRSAAPWDHGSAGVGTMKAMVKT